MLPVISYSITNMSTLTTSFTTSASEFIYPTCQKRYKKQGGFSQHLSIVKRYNILHSNLDKLPETNNEKFKSILVYLIYRKLPHRFKKKSHQLVSFASNPSYKLLINAARSGSKSFVKLKFRRTQSLSSPIKEVEIILKSGALKPKQFLQFLRSNIPFSTYDDQLYQVLPKGPSCTMVEFKSMKSMGINSSISLVKN
ncbi:unnamed protein product [Rhizophagus irregularis]|nr:unnamed protein product [Rhizophagus irregularis]